MARKPNYRFERSERERVKAAKKAERAKRKEERAGKKEEPDTPAPETAGDEG